MSSFPITALVLGSSVAMASAGGSRHTPHRNRKPHHQEEFQKDLYGNSKRSAILRKKFIAKSTLVGGRKLQNYDSGNNNGYTNDQYRQAADYQFEPSNYALSYHRCAAVQQFNDDVAAEEYSDTVFATKSFAIFRFCPADTCDFQMEVDNDDQYQDAVNDQAYYQQENGNGDQYQDAANDQAYDEQGNVEAAYGYQEEQQYTQPEDGQIYGAQGKGCRKNYGEYMIELDDYLQLMVEHQQDRTEQYCTYCDNYMYELYQNYVNYCNNDENCRLRRTLKYEEFKKYDSTAVHDQHRELVDYDMGFCTPYQEGCDGAIDDSVTEYFQCMQAANGVYIGPHCADDGFTITLGVYADEKCSEYTEGVDVSMYVAENLEDDALKSWYNSKHGTLDVLFEGEEQSLCIPCQRKDDEFDAMLEDNGGQVNYNIDDDQLNYNSGMSNLCQQLYETSAHCHRRYSSFSKKNLSKLQYQEEQLNCDFIDSVVVGNYDEMGYVNLKSDWNYRNPNNDPEWVRDNMNAAQFMQSARTVSPLQIFFLIFSILACGILTVWSKTLHTSLTKNGPWAPQRGLSASNVLRQEPRQAPRQSPEINPTDSGIGASRVRSDNSAYYLT